MAQSVECMTLGSGSADDLKVIESSPSTDCTQQSLPKDSLSPAPRQIILSPLSQINKILENMFL